MVLGQISFLSACKVTMAFGTVLLKFGISEKHTKFEKIFLMILTNQLIYLVNVKTMRKIFSNYVCFSKSPNFKVKVRNFFLTFQLFPIQWILETNLFYNLHIYQLFIFNFKQKLIGIKVMKANHALLLWMRQARFFMSRAMLEKAQVNELSQVGNCMAWHPGPI